MTFNYADIVLCLAVLWLLCAFLTLKGRLHSALAPLCALSLASVWTTVAGMLGVLRAGTAAFYLAAAGLGLWALADAARGVTCEAQHACIGPASAHGRWRIGADYERKSAPALLFTPGAVVFWTMSVCFALYLGIRKPIFYDFDEFSLWGTAAKMMSTQNVLYTEGRIAWPWQGTQNCGLMCLSYFVQLFGSFAAWKTYLAYGMLLFACYAAVIGAAEGRFAALVFPVSVLCFLSPWAFSVYMRTITVNHVYLSSYGDIPAGMVFGGAVVFWLCLRETKGPFWTLLPVLALAANIKSNTFVLSLAAAGIVAADVLLFRDGDGAWSEGLVRRIGCAVAAFAAPMGFYLCWNRYIAVLVRRNAENNGMGDTSEALTTVAVNGVKMLLGLPVAPYYEQRRARFYQSISDMLSAFVSTKITMFGSGLVVVAMLLVLTALAAVLLPTGRRRLHAAVLALLCLGCFLAYNFMLVLSYAFVFTEGQGAQLIDYNRYLYTYYMGWFLIVLALLCGAVRAAEGSILHWLGKAGVLVLACGFAFLSVRYLAPEMWLFGYDDSEYDGLRWSEAQAQAAIAAIENDDARQGDTADQRVFFVSQGDNGLRWFMFSYDFLPLVLDYSGFETQENGLYGAGGGTFGLPELRNGDVYYHAYSTDDFVRAVKQNGCTYLFVEAVNDVFIESYASLFTDGLAAAAEGVTLYRVEEDGFAPVANWQKGAAA